MTKPVSQATLEKWQHVIDQWRASGKMALEWCKENQICYETFITRRSQLKKMRQSQAIPKKTDFIELQEPKIDLPGVAIHIRGHMLTVQKNFDAPTLLKCIQVLESIPC
jgi:hypothetical protein